MKTLKVFANDDGLYGNPVGIIVDVARKIDSKERQRIAAESGYSEVVFVNDITTSSISIYTPQREIPFAGHAALGVAYFLGNEYKLSTTELVGIGGKIASWQKEGLTWVSCDISSLPAWNYEHLKTPTEVEMLTKSNMSKKEHTVVWAWIDEQAGVVRARTFAQDWGIPEDEANGSGSMKLALSLGRELIIHHGEGSVIHARPSSEVNQVEVGGLVIL